MTGGCKAKTRLNVCQRARPMLSPNSDSRGYRRVQAVRPLSSRRTVPVILRFLRRPSVLHMHARTCVQARTERGKTPRRWNEIIYNRDASIASARLINARKKRTPSPPSLN